MSQNRGNRQRNFGRGKRMQRTSDSGGTVTVSLMHGGRRSKTTITPGHLNWKTYSNPTAGVHCLKAAQLADGSYLLGNTRGGSFIQASAEEIQAFIEQFGQSTDAKA